MGLFKTLSRLVKAKSEEKAEQIESKNVIAFSKQDIADMEQKLREATRTVGMISGRIATLDEQIKEKNSFFDTKMANAKALKELGATDPKKMDLARSEFESAKNAEKEIEALTDAKTQQEELYKVHISILGCSWFIWFDGIYSAKANTRHSQNIYLVSAP